MKVNKKKIHKVTAFTWCILFISFCLVSPFRYFTSNFDSIDHNHLFSPHSGADDTPPILNEAWISPGVLNAGETVHLYVDATDEDSGIHSVYAAAYYPDRTPAESPQPLIYDSLLGLYYRNFTPPPYRETGVWEFPEIFINDTVGNAKIFSQSWDYYGDFEVIVPNDPLVADIYIIRYSWPIDTEISFVDTSVGGIKPYSYQWNFGDGSPISTLKNPIHGYSQPGEYSVTLIVSDFVGALDSDTILINITQPILKNNFTANSTRVWINQWIQFTDQSSGGTTPYTYLWKFGDLSSDSNESNPIHRYTAAGTYVVSLTVWDNAGHVSEGTLNITIVEATPPDDEGDIPKQPPLINGYSSILPILGILLLSVYVTVGRKVRKK